MNNGWIKLYRQLQDCWVWQENEPFDKRSAWVDLLLTANHSDKKILFNGELIVIERGQILTSIRKLSEKWKWSVNKVYRFIKLLENDDMLKKESDKDRTLITIVNYGVYQCHEYTDRNTDEYTGDTPSETSTETVTEYKQECKELKNDKNEKKYITVSNETVRQTETLRRVISEWNSLQNYGIKAVSRINSGSKRYSSLCARIQEYSVEDVLTAIEKIKNSDFLQGKNKNGWTITFDWFVLPSNFPKVLEGQYDNTSPKNGNTKKLERWNI